MLTQEILNPFRDGHAFFRPLPVPPRVVILENVRIGLNDHPQILTERTTGNLVRRLPDCFARLVDVANFCIIALPYGDLRKAVLEIVRLVILRVDDKTT